MRTYPNQIQQTQKPQTHSVRIHQTRKYYKHQNHPNKQKLNQNQIPKTRSFPQRYKFPKSIKHNKNPTYTPKHHKSKTKPNKSRTQQNSKQQTSNNQTANTNGKPKFQKTHLKQNNRHKLNPNNHHNTQTYTQYTATTTLLQIIVNKTIINPII